MTERTTKLRQALPSIMGAEATFIPFLITAQSAKMIRVLRTRRASEPPTRLARGETANHDQEIPRVVQGTSNRGAGKA
jgi:hypothetical protein